MSGTLPYKSIAILIPCHNEEESITKVVRDFSLALPTAKVYVYNNQSSDETERVAKEAGAFVRNESQLGKGKVVRRMFADEEADVYVLVDGDGTYEAAKAPELVTKLYNDALDMVIGARQASDTKSAYRLGHELGNALLTGTVRLLFNTDLRDMLSGYRVFSRRFVKSFPALSQGFEIETELTVHALALNMPFAEITVGYGGRPKGSQSKLKTYKDGFRIMATIVGLFRRERPLAFFGILFVLLAAASLFLGYPIVADYLRTGLVPRFPTAILATGMMILAFLSLASGFIIDTVTYGRRETRRLAYLAIPLIREF